MARIAGIDLPKKKKIWVALTYIYGIGVPSAYAILDEAQISKEKRVSELSEDEVARIRKIIESKYKVEGDLRKEIAMNIKRLIDAGTYRGTRHQKHLPVRGQRTRTNARTRKGPRKSVVGVRKKVKAPSPS
jgi:small subunit ribosomal protein S13